MEDAGGINQLHIALAFRALVLGQNPDIGGDTRVVKQVGGQCDNGFQQILFQNPAANLAFARCRTARKQRTAVFDNRSATHVVVHLVNSRLHKNQLGVAAARQTCTPASILAALKLVADSILLPGLGVFSCPRRAEGRIFQHEAHLDVGEAILFESIGIAEVFNVLPFNHHLRQTDSVGLGHKFLPEQTHIGTGIVVLDKAVRRAEHTTRSAGLVTDSYNLAIVENIVTALADKDSNKALDNIAARVKLTGIYVLIELANQMLKDIAHLYTVIGLGVQIQVGKRLHNTEQTAVLIHLVDMAEHFKAIEDFLHFGGEALNVHFEIGFNVVWLVAQFFQRVGRGVIELIAGNAVHCLRRIVRIFCKFGQNCFLVRLQGTLQAAQNCHRDNDIAVLIRHIGAAQFVGDAPNKVHFRGDINRGFIPQCVKGNFVRHFYSPFKGTIVYSTYWYLLYHLTGRSTMVVLPKVKK